MRNVHHVSARVPTGIISVKFLYLEQAILAIEPRVHEVCVIKISVEIFTNRILTLMEYVLNQEADFDYCLISSIS